MKSDSQSCETHTLAQNKESLRADLLSQGCICPECRALREAAVLLSQLPEIEPSQDFRARLSQNLPQSNRHTSYWWFPVGAVACAALGLWFFLMPQQNAPDPAITAYLQTMPITLDYTLDPSDTHITKYGQVDLSIRQTASPHPLPEAPTLNF